GPLPRLDRCGSPSRAGPEGRRRAHRDLAAHRGASRARFREALRGRSLRGDGGSCGPAADARRSRGRPRSRPVAGAGAGPDPYRAALRRRGGRGGVVHPGGDACRAPCPDRVRHGGRAPARPGPPALLEDEELWDITPQFVHGDLSEESLFTIDGQISAVRDWSSSKVADAASDLAWLISSLEPERFDDLYAAYREELPTSTHPRLMER